jgi:membrane protease YdiL (CAAX protease family)
VGAFGAAYALRHFRREHFVPLAWCLLITLTLDVIQWGAFLGLGVVKMSPAENGIAGRVAVGVFSFLQYMAVLFVVEEVTFRMLDSHLHDKEKGRGVLSAVLVSAAWGLWHLPIVDALTWETVGALLCVHVPYGVCLSLFWRKTGNLVVPGLCHALGDSIRNAIMLSG